MNDIDLKKIMEAIDELYTYAKSLIPKDIIHSLGFKNLMLKGLIERLVKKWKKGICFKTLQKFEVSTKL